MHIIHIIPAGIGVITRLGGWAGVGIIAVDIGTAVIIIMMAGTVAGLIITKADLKVEALDITISNNQRIVSAPT